jgi:transcriptional regulator with XRE-family HTH domain
LLVSLTPLGRPVSLWYASDTHALLTIHRMPYRHRPSDEAVRRMRRQLAELTGDLVAARRNAGLSQAAVARGIGVSRPLVAAWERAVIVPRLDQLARWAAVLGIETSLRAFPAGPPLRDAGQLRLLVRFGRLIGDTWRASPEAPVSPDPRDRRAFDLLLSRPGRRVAVEAIGRLVDLQAQLRPLALKQQAAGGIRLVVVLADSRHNRHAVRDVADVLVSSFPCRPRTALAALRAGEVPAGDALLLV